MNKVVMYVEAFGGTYVGAYEELIDSGDVTESDTTLTRCRAKDMAVERNAALAAMENESWFKEGAI